MSRATRHVLLFLGCALALAAFQAGFEKEPRVWRLSMGSAYASLVLIALSLAIGPWNVLNGRRNPVSGYFRRDVGIWAGILGIVHVVAGLQVHFSGRMWLYFVPGPEASYRFPLRLDPFGLANHAGLVATLLLALLLALSNNASLKSLGPARWKSLQRWNYAIALLVLAHGAVYMVLEKRSLAFVAMAAAIVIAVAAMQGAGWRATRSAGR